MSQFVILRLDKKRWRKTLRRRYRVLYLPVCVPQAARINHHLEIGPCVDAGGRHSFALEVRVGAKCDRKFRSR